MNHWQFAIHFCATVIFTGNLKEKTQTAAKTSENIAK